MDIFTDMGIELARDVTDDIDNISSVVRYDNIILTKSDLRGCGTAEKLGKRAGLYYTIEGGGDIASGITRALCGYDYDCSRVLLVGLGNPEYSADALGSLVLDCIPLKEGRVYKYYPLTAGVTGIESYDAVCAISKMINPTLVLAVDSLATVDAGRLGKIYQLTSAGIIPGGGVGHARKLFDRQSLGVDIIAIGVPFVCNITRKAGSPLIITASDINTLVKACAKNIAKGITDYLRK